MLCPCGTNIEYTICCGIYHNSDNTAASAEKLMRSRYSAFVLKNEDYLLRTWHPSKRPKNLDLRQDKTEWLSLTIIRTQKGSEKDYDGIVEFIAEFQENGTKHKLHESSNFIKKNGNWLYRDGKIIS